MLQLNSKCIKITRRYLVVCTIRDLSEIFRKHSKPNCQKFIKKFYLMCIFAIAPAGVTLEINNLCANYYHKHDGRQNNTVSIILVRFPGFG